MRAKILGLLRENMPEPVSGEEISIQLGVSRTAVWKHIQSLKNAGYDIESVPKKGYILHKAPDLLRPEEIVAHLSTKWVGHHIHYLKEANSSNEVGKGLADKGCADGTVIVAEEQTSGKGRLSRGWFSPAGCGVWCSVVLRPPFMPSEASKCTLLAAVAVIKAINKYKGVNAKIKWPNDVLLEGKKMVGILTEMSAEFGRINYIVIGTGINTNVPKSIVPDELKDLAISVADVAKEPIRRVQILADYLQNIEELYETVLQEGFGPVLDEWRKYSDTIGQAVKVIAPDKTYFGTAVEIDEEGLLIVKKEDGTLEKVIAGDVSIRPAAAQGKRYS
ncbi:MAG: biotin--[Acidaminococcaceae bacterium]|nr:biotin--[acetyl-CoA-carboxylase] ligase [Acidaminococcaceae bacterium]